MTTEEQYKYFQELDKKASQGGGVERVEKQHANGHMTARERIDMLLDKGTFNEIDKFVIHHCTDFGMEKNHIPGDGIVCGYGKVDGRLVYVYAYDFTVYGGTLSVTGDCLERLGWCTYSGRCGKYLWLCFYLLSEHYRFRCYPTDFRYPWSLCRWCLLFSCTYRLHLHGEGKEPHVHHRTGCG